MQRLEGSGAVRPLYESLGVTASQRLMVNMNSIFTRISDKMFSLIYV